MAFPAELFLTRRARDDGMCHKVPYLHELNLNSPVADAADGYLTKGRLLI
jgi:hypothetical protein